MYIKNLKIPFYKTNYCNLVTLCHGFRINYRLAHALNSFQLLTVSSIPCKTYKYRKVPTFWCYCSHFIIGVNIFVSASFQIFKFQKFYGFLGRIHTNRIKHLLLWYEYRSVLKSKQRTYTILQWASIKYSRPLKYTPQCRR